MAPGRTANTPLTVSTNIRLWPYTVTESTVTRPRADSCACAAPASIAKKVAAVAATFTEADLQLPSSIMS